MAHFADDVHQYDLPNAINGGCAMKSSKENFHGSLAKMQIDSNLPFLR